MKLLFIRKGELLMFIVKPLKKLHPSIGHTKSHMYTQLIDFNVQTFTFDLQEVEVLSPKELNENS